MTQEPNVKIRSYRDLRVWQKGVHLVVVCYQLAKKLPADERFGLISQIQRAAVSIPANIAEGYARRTRGDYVHHLAIASESLAELETHWTIVVRLEYLQESELESFVAGANELWKMLKVLMQKLRAKSFDSETLVPDPWSLILILYASEVALIGIVTERTASLDPSMWQRPSKMPPASMTKQGEWISPVTTPLA